MEAERISTRNAEKVLYTLFAYHWVKEVSDALQPSQFCVPQINSQ